MRLDEAQFTHLVVEGVGARGCQKDYMVRSFLGTCVAAMKMTPVGEPGVHSFGLRDGHTDSGVTGFQIIIESHLSIHTWPEWDNFVAIDLFSCKPFDVAQLRQVCQSYWRFSRMVTRLVPRNELIDALREGRSDA